MTFSGLSFISLFLFSIAITFADTIPEIKSDTLVNMTTPADSSEIPDSTFQAPESKILQSPALPSDSAITISDTSVNSTGLFFGIGAGLTMGNLPLVSLWKNSLADSLTHLGLQENSFIITPDTLLPDSLQIADTSKLAFRIKEKPSIYNMTFPIKLSIAKINDNNFFKASVIYSLIYKNQKSIVFAADDTLNRRIDLKQKIFLHSVSMEVNYGIKIPPQYFSIESIEKSYLFIGFGISPLLYLKSVNQIENKSDDIRMKKVERSISENSKKQSAFGTTFTFKTGISAIRHLSSNGIAEVSLCYSLNWFDYFYKNGKRLQKSDFDPAQDKKDLSFLSNRFEIGVSLFRKHDSKK